MRIVTLLDHNRENFTLSVAVAAVLGLVGLGFILSAPPALGAWVEAVCTCAESCFLNRL